MPRKKNLINAQKNWFAKVRYDAKKRNKFEWNLQEEDLDFGNVTCKYLNIPIDWLGDFRVGNYNRHSPSLDRIDPTKGYTKGNVQIISLLANQMKSCATEAELKTFAQNVLKSLTMSTQ